jgi:site-specific recombinase XerD
MRGLIVVLWRAGLRISEALALAESDLDPARGAILVRCGKGGKRREVGMDPWAWDQLAPWLQQRTELRSAHCSASSTALLEAVRGQRPPRENSFAGSRRAPVCADGSLHTSCVRPRR